MTSPAVIEAVAADPAIRPTRVEIDLGAVRDNANLVAGICGVDLYAVVKADAYGHGAVPVARALANAPGVAGVAVSLVEEGTSSATPASTFRSWSWVRPWPAAKKRSTLAT